MATFKTLLLFLLAGAFVGAALGTAVGRSWLPWYNTPGMGTQSLCDLPTVVKGTIHDFLRYQLIGAAAGAVVGLIGGIWTSRRKRTPPVGATATPAA